MQELYGETDRREDIDLSLHDPLCIYYLLSYHVDQDNGWCFIENRDVRIETGGWGARGMCVVDRRRRIVAPPGLGGGELPGEWDEEVGVLGDEGGWLDGRGGNRVRQVVKSGGKGTEGVGRWMAEKIFGC